jgi:hypothetical protein
MGQELLKGDYIQADETPVDVQMHDGRGKNHQAYLWQYSRPTGPVVFDFRMGREHRKQAGPRVAAIISVVETCRRLKILVRDYLSSVLPGLDDFPVGRIAELTPAIWAPRN